MIDGLTSRQITAAMLVALNHTDTEIVKNLHMSSATFWKWQKLPIFQERVAAYRQQMFERLAGQTIDEIMADAPNTFKRLKELREERVNPQVALGACRTLFDRQVPVKTLHQEDRTIRIVLERRDEETARAVLEEDRLIDADATLVEEDTAHAAPSSA